MELLLFLIYLLYRNYLGVYYLLGIGFGVKVRERKKRGRKYVFMEFGV